MHATATKVGFTAALLLGAIGLLARPAEPAPHYLMVDELLRDPALWADRPIKVHG